jgi:hypothetical protein
MATKADLIVDQGSTYSTTVNLFDQYGDPLYLANYSCAAQIRKWYTSSNSISFSTSLDPSGLITLSLSSNQTGSMTAGRYVYDVELTDTANNVSRVLEGIVTVTPQVTR